MAVDEKLDIIGNEPLNMDVDHLRTLAEINKYRADVLRMYRYDTDEIKVFIDHYLTIRLKDKVKLLIASSVDPIERKTKVLSVVPETILKSYLGGSKRRKTRKRTMKRYH